jgi:hypothetical protein
MRAKQLIDGASFGPDALQAIGKAFDAAWADIAGNFGNDPAEIETARLKLAKAMLSIADDDSKDVAALKQAALERMALEYRSAGPHLRAYVFSLALPRFRCTALPAVELEYEVDPSLRQWLVKARVEPFVQPGLEVCRG